MTPSRDIIHANGADLCVETFGDPADPAIVLMHGGGGSLLSWDEEFCERLADRFVVRYDLRDAGRSVTGSRYSIRDLAADAVGLLDAFGVARGHFVGMSLGGGIAQLLALDHPGRVASITLVSCTPGGPGHATPDLPRMSEELAAFFAAEPPEPDWADREAVAGYLVALERPFAGAAFDAAAARSLAGRVFDRSPRLAEQLRNAFMPDVGEPWRPRLGSVAVPALVIHGTHDPLFPLAHGRALAAEIPGARLLALERVGHEYPPRETWDVVVPAILQLTG